MIVVNYNGLRFLDECLTAVLAQELSQAFEVVVVDNASTDSSAACIRERYPSVRLIQAGRNLGFAGGNNLGIRASHGRYVVLLNNDTAVRPGWLAALVNAAETDPKVGAVSGKLLFKNQPGTIQNAGILLLSDGSGADRGFREPDHGQYDSREEVFGACGASALYRREMLDDVGLLDETFFMYYEDTDLSWRMRLRGWRVLYEPAAVVDHVHAGTSREWSPFFIFHVDRNRLFMVLKNGSGSFVLRSFVAFAGMAASSAAGALGRRMRDTSRPSERGAVGSHRVRIHVRVVASLLYHLPEMLLKRREIQGRRKVDHATIRTWLYPREQWRGR